MTIQMATDRDLREEGGLGWSFDTFEDVNHPASEGQESSGDESDFAFRERLERRFDFRRNKSKKLTSLAPTNRNRMSQESPGVFSSKPVASGTTDAPAGAAGSTGIPKTHTKDNRQCYGCGGKGHLKYNCPLMASSIECWKCHQIGHIRRNCPTKATGMDGYPPDIICWCCGGRGHVQLRCPQAYETCTNEVSQPTPAVAETEESVRMSGECLYTRGMVGTVPVDFLIDTGCRITSMDWHVWEKMIPSPVIDDRCAIILLCAKGEPVQTYGFCAVTFEIGGEMISGDAIVADIPGCQVLIGMDLLEDLDCSIDIASKKLIVGKLGISVPLYKKKVQRCARVEVSETMYVPPGFEMRLPGQVTGRWESLGPTGRVEELVSFHRDSNLMVAKALESPVAQVGKRERGQPMGVTQLTESMTRARRTSTRQGKKLAEGLVKKGSQAANKGSSQGVLASRTAPVRPRGPSVGPARELAPEKGGMGPSGMVPMVSKLATLGGHGGQGQPIQPLMDLVLSTPPSLRERVGQWMTPHLVEGTPQQGGGIKAPWRVADDIGEPDDIGESMPESGAIQGAVWGQKTLGPIEVASLDPTGPWDRGLAKDLLRVHRPGCTRTASMKFGIMPLYRRTWLRCH